MGYSESFARSVFQEFDTKDAISRDFLESLVVDGCAPAAEINQVVGLSIASGVERWDLLFERAHVLRNGSKQKAEVKSGGLLPYLGMALAEEDSRQHAKQSHGHRRRPGGAPELLASRGFGRRSSSSHFWAETKNPPPENERLGDSYHPAVGRAKGVKVKHARPLYPTPTIHSASPAILSQETRMPSAQCQRGSRSGKRGSLKVEHHQDAGEEQSLGIAVTRRTTRSRTLVATSRRTRSISAFFPSPPPEDPKGSSDAGGLASASPLTPTSKRKRHARGTVSALPFPPLTDPKFGLAQERLAHDPFRMLVALNFLIRTPGRVSMPVYRRVMERWPTPEALAEANPADIIDLTHHLGLSARRAATIQKLARSWLENPPSRLRRYGVKDYPQKGVSTPVKAGQLFGPEVEQREDDQSNEHGSESKPELGINDLGAAGDARRQGLGWAWEIGHLTQGRYTLDSWRIFCRDELLGRATDWTGKGCSSDFQPEWMRVLPEDKELRAYLRWLWMREGWNWDPFTGERTILEQEMREAVNAGRVCWDGTGTLVILEADSLTPSPST
jgi:hypothetical protein